MKRFFWMICALALAACSDQAQQGDDHEHGDEHAELEAERGPHGGRMLRSGDTAVELLIFERGIPPEFHAYLYEKNARLAPTDGRLTVKLTRLDGEVTELSFAPQEDFLRSDGIVREPHSFDVEVSLQRGTAQPVQWSYASYEGRTTIADATAQSMGVETQRAQAATLHEQLILSGTVQADPTRVSAVRARYPGVIREVLVEPSSRVQQGATLAQIQSNESLQNYPLRAPIAGTIIEHQARIGEATGDDALFTIVDTSRVWVELDVFQNDLPSVRAGQKVQIFNLDEQPIASGAITRIGTLATHASQTVQARVVIDNTAGLARPGQFVTARVDVATHQVPLAVERDALQTLNDFRVVFEKVGEVYEARPLELGRGDAKYVEVLEGLKPNAQYVIRNSYLIKADIEKSGAGHDH